MGQFGVGQPVTRVEDDRFVIGKGRYTDDINLEGQAYAYMLRSPMAHADILSIDTAEAEAADGVLAVITGKDLQEAGLGPLPCPAAAGIKNRDGSAMYTPERPAIAVDRVRYVGDTVACVVATSLARAKDAADLIFVDYDERPAIADTEAAAAHDAPVIWEEHGSNIVFDWGYGDEDAANEAFAKAAHVTRVKLINNRIVVNSMEPRNALADYDADRDHYTFYVGSQGVHGLRNYLSKDVLRIPPEKLRVITEDVGGGFGMKTFLYPEYPVVCYASKRLGRPVKWSGERGDAFISDIHGRDNVTTAELALDDEARILGVRVSSFANLGAYLSQFGPFIPTRAPHKMHMGVYRVPALFTNVRGVMTNTVPVDAYRGAGRPEASYVIERLMDKAARELELGPDEIRRRNFVPPSAMPADPATALPFDSGDFEQCMNAALEKADYAGFEKRRAEKEARGLIAGIGISYYVERTAANSSEYARVHVHPEGRVTVNVGTQTNGQGHETAWAQYLSDRLGVPFDSIKVERGDTDTLARGGGTGGSRSLYMAAGAIESASEDVIEKGKKLAANELEAAEADIEFRPVEGAPVFAVVGTDRTVGLFDIATAAAGQADIDEDALIGDGTFEHKDNTFPNGCHVCEIEIDPETGVTRIVRYTVVDDFGKIMNPLLVAGQVHGGIVQGLGQAMGELAVYDESGQLITGSYMDYWMPRASDFPDFDVSYIEIPCTTNPLGVKGCGEAGTVGAPQAFINAVIDALAPYGIEAIDMPITPQKVWSIIQDRSGRAAA